MSIRDMKEFAELRRTGDSTAPARLELLSRHRDVVRRRIADLADSLDALDSKIDYYRMLTTAGVT